MNAWPQGSGDMARRIQAHDWTGTDLGPPHRWSHSLRTTVDLMLGSGHAMQLAWGAQRTVLYNDAYAPMLGGHHPRALGLPFHQAWPDVWTDIEPLVERVFAGETVRFDDMPLRMQRNGFDEETWWNFSYSPVRDESGAVAGLLNVTVDATPQHRAQQAERERDEAHARIQRSEARFRALMEAGGNSLYRMSPDWRLMFQLDSQGLASTTEPIDNWVEKYIPAEERGAVFDAIGMAIRSKSLFELEHRVYQADGRIGWVLSRAVPLLGADGQITEWFGAASDVTARKLAEQQLREREERHAFLLKLGDALRPGADADAIGDTATRLVAEHLHLDRCCLAQLSQEAGTYQIAHEWRAAHLPSILGEHDLRNFSSAMQRMETQPLSIADVQSDETLSERDRQSLAAMAVGAVLVAPLRDGPRHCVWAMAAAATAPRAWTCDERRLLEEAAERTWAAMQRARAETALHEADRRKDQFLAVLGHELRNGLAPLVYNVKIGNRARDNLELMQQLFVRSDRQLHHLVHLVDDLLDVARITTGKISLQMELLKPREFVGLALDACRADAERRHHRLTVTDETTSDLHVRGDRVRLTQVMSNLLSNATKYMDEGGSITVHLAQDQGHAILQVRDTGIGIPASALAQVFGLFTQVREQQAYSAGGLGIGLAIVKQLVEMQGGSVGVASEGTGRGSVFTVRLPIVPAEMSQGMAATAVGQTACPQDALCILVVDDQRDAAHALSELLRVLGHDAQAVYGGPEALESVRQRRPDLVLLDLSMPDMDGFEVARQLRSAFAAEPRMHVVALTGLGQAIDRQRTQAAGFDGHLVKPANEAELDAVLSQARRPSTVRA